LNALYGATMVEMSKSIGTLELGERTRGQLFEKMFMDRLKQMKELDLTMVGATRTSTGGKLFAGGLTQASKTEMKQDILPRFTRDMARTPGVLDMSGTSSS
jgi:hypothetical protein